MHPLHEIWPPARVRVITPRLELRLPTDEEIVALVERGGGGNAAPHTRRYGTPWTEEHPRRVARRAYKWHAQCRASWTPDRWSFLPAVFVDGEPAGAQDLSAANFAITREVESGSWLGARFQGRGLGTEMRQAVLHLAFEGLGARTARSGAYEDNGASIGVSTRCGYEPDGTNVVVRRRGPMAPGGESADRAIEQRFLITRERWLDRRRDDITIEGLDPGTRIAFGAADVD
jgi:RimJ/RimL family protein N-acetyltransferase